LPRWNLHSHLHARKNNGSNIDLAFGRLKGFFYVSTTYTPSAGTSVLGYELQEHIGSGGYGEVWRAKAPGGISKAIKFIFGVHDGNRAQVELKALDKIKEVRHPFLLSLDRIEAVDGRLIVVTELADGSLADIFNKYLTEGKSGIPREELLQYMRDSADALDYLSNTHSLQHLDIKPENLLVVSNHIKVADFGLVKNIHNVTQSLMNGLTPTYAPPELFDGKPSRFSDQYSLAIVYQEMLTGERPFSGTTPAQLAAQHMHGKPNLNPLPRGDQNVIQRALSKNPETRFPTCREMVEELANRKSRNRIKARRGLLSQNDNENGTVQLAGSDSALPDVTNQISSGVLPIKQTDVKLQAAFDLESETARTRPTLIVGVGKTGTNAVRELRRLMNQRVASREEIPSLQFLCFDTDRQSLAQAICSIENDALDPTETVEIKLSSAQDFRGKAANFSSWLSRRWVYNIPKSLQTEGLRPLGRLAFADHIDEIFNRFQSAFKKLLEPGSIAQTAETLDMDPDGEPRIIFVTSIAGGIGSGSILDLAYTARTVLSDLGHHECSVDGVLIHSTAKVVGNRELNIANSFACLAELRHFVEYGYPGDESCGLPEFEEELPFDNSYFVNFGQNLDPARYTQRVEEVAEYLFLDIATPCQTFFESSRRIEVGKDAEFGLRSFGIRCTGLPSKERLDEELAQGLIEKWIDRTAKSPEIDAAAEDLIAKLQIQDGVLQTHWLSVSKNYIDEFSPNLVEDVVDVSYRRLEDALAAISQKIGEAMENCGGIPMAERLEEAMNDDFDKKIEVFQSSISKFVNNPGIRVGGALATIETIRQKLVDNSNELDSSLEMIQSYQSETLQELHTYFASRKGDTRPQLGELIERFISMMVHHNVIESCRNYCRKWKSVLSDSESGLNDHARSIQLLGRLTDDHRKQVSVKDSTTNNVSKSIVSATDVIRDSLVKRMPELVDKLDNCLESRFGETTKLIDCLDVNSNLNRQLPDLITTMARNIVASELRQIEIDQLLNDAGYSEEQFANWINEQIGDSFPVTNDCGGDGHFLVALPQNSTSQVDTAFIKDKFEADPTVMRGTCGQFLTCFEYKNVPLSNVAFRLLEDNPECFELVERIHTRTDVDWIKSNAVFS